MSEKTRTCAKCGKSTATNNVTLFRWPNPGVRNIVRCTVWAKYLFPNEDEKYCSVTLQKRLYTEHKMLCEDHFSADAFLDVSKKKLLRTAIPCDGDEPATNSSICFVDVTDTLSTQTNKGKVQPASHLSISYVDVANTASTQTNNRKIEPADAGSSLPKDVKRIPDTVSSNKTKQTSGASKPAAPPTTFRASELARCCRWCLVTGGEMSPVFGASLDLMLKSIASLGISEGDEYPQQACNTCIRQLSVAYRFQQMVLSNHKILGEALKKNETELHEDEILETVNEITESNDGLREQTRLDEEITIADKELDGYEETSVTNCIMEYGEDTYSISTIEDEATITVEEKSKPVKCPHCPLMLFDEPNLKIHLNTHRELCKVCKKSIPRHRLARHMLTHADVKPHVCKMCKKRFADSSNFARHVASHTKKAGLQKAALCPLCGKTFKWASSLYKHMRHHTGRGLYECLTCARAFSSPSTLKVHMLTHQGSKFECRECSSTFTQSSSLSKHVRTKHRGDRKQFACGECGHLFMNKESMALHVSRIHRGVTPYKCRECNRTFGYQKSLKKHKCSLQKEDSKMSSDKDIRTISVKYLCITCGLKFDTTEQMKIHNKACTKEGIPAISEPPENKCGMCTLSYSEFDELLAHYSTAHGYHRAD